MSGPGQAGRRSGRPAVFVAGQTRQERRPLVSRQIQDVVRAEAAELTLTRTSRLVGSRSVKVLRLTLRDGGTWTLSPGTPSIGKAPANMAEPIERFIHGQAEGSHVVGAEFSFRRFPWLVNLCAAPFLLIPILAFGEISLRAVGYFQRRGVKGVER